MCTCTRSMFVELPVHQEDYFRYYGRQCACMRLLCQTCGMIVLESHYVNEHGMLLDDPVVPPYIPPSRKVQPFVMSKEAADWIERKREKQRFCQHKLRRRSKYE